MSIVKRLSVLVMAVIAAITFCSCDKEGTETGSASGIVGTWRVMRLEYSFNGETVGKRPLRMERFINSERMEKLRFR